MEICLVAQKESDFWIEFGKIVGTQKESHPNSAVPMVTWDVEMSWKEWIKKNLTLLLDYATMLVSYHLFLLPYWVFITLWLGKRHKACEGTTEQAVNNHRDTLPRWLSALLEQQTWHFHPKGLFLSEKCRFLWIRSFRWLNDTRFIWAAQSSLHVQGDNLQLFSK